MYAGDGGEAARRVRGDVLAGGRGLRGRTGAMEAPRERRRIQGVSRWAKGPFSFVMPVMAAKPPGASGPAFVSPKAGPGTTACKGLKSVGDGEVTFS